MKIRIKNYKIAKFIIIWIKELTKENSKEKVLNIFSIR